MCCWKDHSYPGKSFKVVPNYLERLGCQPFIFQERSGNESSFPVQFYCASSKVVKIPAFPPHFQVGNLCLCSQVVGHFSLSFGEFFLAAVCWVCIRKEENKGRKSLCPLWSTPPGMNGRSFISTGGPEAMMYVLETSFMCCLLSENKRISLTLTR